MEILPFETLQYLAIILGTALIAAKILGKLHFPDVTGYLIAGIIIGPMVLNLVPKEGVKSLEILSEIALAIIAFSIGAEMNWGNIKRLGKSIGIITFLEAFGAFVFVTLTLLFVFRESLPYSFILGSIACATAPAATLMVVRQYKAKGPVVDTLIPVVALDDAICVMAFGIASSVGTAMLGGGALNFGTAFFEPIKEILFSLALGGFAGAGMTVLNRFIKNQAELTSVILGSIFIMTSLALRFHLSSLLVMMSYGFALCNLSTMGHKALTALDGLSAPLFICFFTLSGADLDFSVFAGVGLLAAGYILSRVVGKIVGAYIGCRISGLPKTTQKFLGFTLLPQAGVAIGLSLAASRILPDPFGTQIRAIILSATVVYELTGPIITKIALTKAGEIKKS